LKEQAGEQKEKHEEELERDRREIERIRRRIELLDSRFALEKKTLLEDDFSPVELQRFHAWNYIRDIYKSASRISSRGDLGLDGLLENSRLRNELAPEDWNYIDWMSRNFEHCDPMVQQEVRTAAGRIYTYRAE
jgi:hypothetical protein